MNNQSLDQLAFEKVTRIASIHALYEMNYKQMKRQSNHHSSVHQNPQTVLFVTETLTRPALMGKLRHPIK